MGAAGGGIGPFGFGGVGGSLPLSPPPAPGKRGNCRCSWRTRQNRAPGKKGLFGQGQHVFLEARASPHPDPTPRPGSLVCQSVRLLGVHILLLPSGLFRPASPADSGWAGGITVPTSRVRSGLVCIRVARTPATPGLPHLSESRLVRMVQGAQDTLAAPRTASGRSKCSPDGPATPLATCSWSKGPRAWRPWVTAPCWMQADGPQAPGRTAVLYPRGSISQGEQ